MTSLTLTTARGNGQLLRRDARGRVRTGRERRESLLAQFDRSGVSAAVFARMAGINYQTFAGWLHVRRRRGQRVVRAGSNRKDRVQWIEAVPLVPKDPASTSADDALPAPGMVRLHLPGGAWLTVSSGPSVAVAAELVRALAAQGGGAC